MPGLREPPPAANRLAPQRGREGLSHLAQPAPGTSRPSPTPQRNAAMRVRSSSRTWRNAANLAASGPVTAAGSGSPQ